MGGANCFPSHPPLTPPLHAQLPESQLYAVFVLADGGCDLESFVLRDAAEARAVLLSVTATLAVAEEAFQFEHRDLHWGNVLLARQPGAPAATHVLRGVRTRSEVEGLRCTIIDFTLSRMRPKHNSAVVFCDLEADPELFDGAKGDMQAETYRRMRKAVRKDWSAYCPRTNALWLHYLADVLLSKKQFSATKEERCALRGFRARCAKYERAADALLDELFAGMWEPEQEAR